MDTTSRRLAQLSEIRSDDKSICCPQCGSITFKQAFDGERECKGCGQSWYADVEYEPVSEIGARATL